MTQHQAIISRAEARANGLTTYFNGKPCPKGHVSARKVSGGNCVECARLSSATWHANNQQRASAYGAAYRSFRGEDLLAKKREYQKAWCEANKEEKRRRDAEYERSKREARCVNFLTARSAIEARRRASALRASASWADQQTVEGMYELAQLFRSIGLNVHVDHIVPLQGKTVCGLHTQDNLQLMIGSANQSKSNKSWPDM